MSVSAAALPRPQRVILIQADDLGYDDLGCSGNPLVRTPHLDRLAAASTRLTDFTVNPVCAPSRATLLTGRHFLRTGVSHVHGGRDFLHRDEVTLAQLFQRAGWATAMWGKWHLGTGDGYEPWQRGFDEAQRLRLYKHEDAMALGFDGETATGKWADTWIFDQAIHFLQTRGDAPAFLYLPTMTPHAPLVCPEPERKAFQEAGLTEGLARLYGMVSFLDQQIGRLLATLDERGLSDDTLVIFTSDNGPAINDQALTDAERSLRKVGGLRGWKGDLWQAGVRVPCFLRWPAGLSAGVVARPIDQADLLPTLARWCGLATDALPFPLDGRDRTDDLCEFALNPAMASPLFNYSDRGWITGSRPYDPLGLPAEYNPVDPATLDSQAVSVSVRLDRFKLVRNPDQPDAHNQQPHRSMLIDLWLDPGETTDVSDEHPVERKRLDRLLDDWVNRIRQEPHAFAPPVIRVGEGGERFPAKLAARIEGDLQNSVRGVFGWTERGQSISWQLELATRQELKVGLHWRELPTDGTVVTLQTGGREVLLMAAPDERGRWESDQPLTFAAGANTLTLHLTQVGPNPATACLVDVSLLDG